MGLGMLGDACREGAACGSDVNVLLRYIAGILVVGMGISAARSGYHARHKDALAAVGIGTGMMLLVGSIS